MKITQELTIITGLILMGVFFTAYIIYGRIKRKPLLVGDYKPGMPGYKEFLKIVNNNWYLAAAILTTIFSLIVFANDVLVVLNGPYHNSMLITSPALAVIIFVAALLIIPRALGKKYKNEK